MTKKLIFAWLPFAFVITAFFASLYAIVQQNYRTSANDPQIQIALDTAAALEAGQMVDPNAPVQKIDLKKSLATFVILFDDSNKPIFSNAQLNNETPVPPKGVFEFAKTHSQDRITWAPQKDVRLASVIQRYQGKTPGYVLVGRSLKAIEEREMNLLYMVAAAYVATLLGSAVLIFITHKK